jgi:hypothetical protein
MGTKKVFPLGVGMAALGNVSESFCLFLRRLFPVLITNQADNDIASPDIFLEFFEQVFVMLKILLTFHQEPSLGKVMGQFIPIGFKFCAYGAQVNASRGSGHVSRITVYRNDRVASVEPAQSNPGEKVTNRHFYCGFSTDFDSRSVLICCSTGNF